MEGACLLLVRASHKWAVRILELRPDNEQDVTIRSLNDFFLFPLFSFFFFLSHDRKGQTTTTSSQRDDRRCLLPCLPSATCVIALEKERGKKNKTTELLDKNRGARMTG